jgi:glycerol transport system ATP-binding protein
LFDEPLTVIDPHLKWQLRRKLKQVHQELKLTLIYVTHDQVEALTFAEEVVVMTRGKAVQIGSAEDLFEKPAHTFVGHFIGSPGMNFLAGEVDAQHLLVGERRIGLNDQQAQSLQGLTNIKLGIRPEYVHVEAQESVNTIPAQVERVQDLGTSMLMTMRCAGHVLRARLPLTAQHFTVGSGVHVSLLGKHTCFYHNEELVV